MVEGRLNSAEVVLKKLVKSGRNKCPGLKAVDAGRGNSYVGQTDGWREKNRIYELLRSFDAILGNQTCTVYLRSIISGENDRK